MVKCYTAILQVLLLENSVLGTSNGRTRNYKLEQLFIQKIKKMLEHTVKSLHSYISR